MHDARVRWFPNLEPQNLPLPRRDSKRQSNPTCLSLPDVALDWRIHENEVFPNGKLHQLCVAMQIQDFHDAVFVKSHGSRCKVQGMSDLLHGESLRQQLQYVAL